MKISRENEVENDERKWKWRKMVIKRWENEIERNKKFVILKKKWYLYNQFCTIFVTTTFSLFLLDKNSRERKKRENKKHVNINNKVVSKVVKSGCTYIIFHI